MRLAEALDVNVRRLQRIDQIVGALLGEASPLDSAHMRDLQALDVVAQEISCVGRLLDDLAGRVPKDCRIDTEDFRATMKVERLSCLLADEPAMSRDATACPGDCELFEQPAADADS